MGNLYYKKKKTFGQLCCQILLIYWLPNDNYFLTENFVLMDRFSGNSFIWQTSKPCWGREINSKTQIIIQSRFIQRDLQKQVITCCLLQFYLTATELSAYDGGPHITLRKQVDSQGEKMFWHLWEQTAFSYHDIPDIDVAATDKYSNACIKFTHIVMFVHVLFNFDCVGKTWKIYISMTPTLNNFRSHNKICSHICNESVGRAVLYIANRIRKATIKQNSPIASDRAKPRMAYENSCCFKDGFLQTKISQ